jgi:AcrR family transcriptional regulator
VSTGQAILGKECAALAPDGSARQRLLREAADIFSRKGYAATSVGEIVAAAGVTKPVLYYHFESKEKLYLTLIEESIAHFRKAIENSYRDETGTVADRIRRLCDVIVGHALENLSIVRLTHGMHYAPPEGAPACHHGCEFPYTIHAMIRDLVELGVRSGEFKPAGHPIDLVWTIMGLVSVCINSNLVDPAPALTPAGFRSALNLVFAGVAPAGR